MNDVMVIGIAGMFLAPFGMLISKWAALNAFVDADNVLLVLHGVYAGHDLYLLLADDEAKEHVAQVGDKTFRWSGRVDIQYNH